MFLVCWGPCTREGAAARPTSDSNDGYLRRSAGFQDDPLDNTGTDTERPGNLEDIRADDDLGLSVSTPFTL